MTTSTVSLPEARRLALSAQSFGRLPHKEGGKSGWPLVRETIRKMGVLQIDAINVLVRSHYLPVFSRLGPYNTSQFDKKSFHPQQRELFEYWGHEASLLPLDSFPLFSWRMERAKQLQGIYKDVAEFVRDRRQYINGVYKQIQSRGPLTARQIANPGSKTGTWEWRDSKIALEYLFWSGKLSARTRIGFERVYDLTERVIPANILSLPVPDACQAQRELIKISIAACGIAIESDLRDYFRLSTQDTKQCLHDLVDNGDIIPVRVEGWRQPAYLAAGIQPLKPIRCSALLSPFDPLIWQRDRTQRLFDFYYRLEIYKPIQKRKYGYFVLPFLLNENLVGRVDLKNHRRVKTLEVISAYAEDSQCYDDTAQSLAENLIQLAAWLGLENIRVTKRRKFEQLLRRQIKQLE